MLLNILSIIQIFLLGYNDGTKVGDLNKELKNGATAVEAINDFNGFLLKLMLYAGAIVIAIAVIKLIIAMQQQDPQQKMQAALMFGLGSMFVASDAIITYMNISSSSSEDQIVIRLVEIVGTVLKLVAIILIALAIFQLILSFLNEDAAQKVDAGKALAIGSVFYCLRTVLVSAVTIMVDSTTTNKMEATTGYVIDIIADVARFIGVMLAVYGLFQVIIAMKEQDSTYIQRNITMVTVGMLLWMTPIIFNAMGINATQTVTVETPAPTTNPKPKPGDKTYEVEYDDRTTPSIKY